MIEIKNALRRGQSGLIALLQSGNLTREQYLEYLNTSLRVAMEQCRSLLGDDDFQAVFGKAGGHPESLIDRDVFLAQIGQVAPGIGQAPPPCPHYWDANGRCAACEQKMPSGVTPAAPPRRVVVEEDGFKFTIEGEDA